ncbi:hypothetical protein [Pontibacillus salipaludis]|uniref:Uncharacterized protein n=1 Tax=Pontibacillus salipaludis TaxID=1697394 RepID=A0ABQ1QK48_9BACI|nr:hypothetical protein [Pontibacillus salipaludis]GGD28854.1 hypothetical protein GCM10011389_40570 [Pontibacillus salipaludis]
MEEKYWKVVCGYGHVGQRNEVSVARYLVTGKDAKLLDVYALASQMPGVKHRGVRTAHPISKEAYIKGKTEEKNNFYLQKLMTFQEENSNQTA